MNRHMKGYSPIGARERRHEYEARWTMVEPIGRHNDDRLCTGLLVTARRIEVR
jgi:hypothetical protein